MRLIRPVQIVAMDATAAFFPFQMHIMKIPPVIAESGGFPGVLCIEQIAVVAIEAQGIAVNRPLGIQPGGERFRQQSRF